MNRGAYRIFYPGTSTFLSRAYPTSFPIQKRHKQSIAMLEPTQIF